MRPVWIRLFGFAIIASLVLGTAGRAVMRFVAWESGEAAGFSLGGSVDVILFGALVGTGVALGFWLVRPHIPLPAPWLGVILGLSLFVGFVWFPPQSARSALAATPDTPLFTALSFGGLLVAWSVALDVLGRHVSRR